MGVAIGGEMTSNPKETIRSKCGFKAVQLTRSVYSGALQQTGLFQLVLLALDELQNAFFRLPEPVDGNAACGWRGCLLIAKPLEEHMEPRHGPPEGEPRRVPTKELLNTIAGRTVARHQRDFLANFWTRCWCFWEEWLGRPRRVIIP